VNIVGPPVGALLLEILPLQGILAIDVGTAMLAVAPLLFVPIPQPGREPAEGATLGGVSVLDDVREGMRYVRGWPGLFAVLIMAAVINLLLTPATSLMPILVTDHFGGQALELGWLESAWGVGVVAGGLILSAWGGFKRRILTSLTGLTGIGVGFLLVGLTPASGLILAIGAIFLAGTMNPITNGPLFSIIQASVDPGMQGRVFALVQSMAAAATPLGMIIAGPVADALGVRLWYVVGGVGCLMMGVGGFFVPAIVHLEDQPAASVPDTKTVTSVCGGCAEAPQLAE
jgi:DHA3 family macrolide efflux protein-like MFS transporter